MDLYDIAVARKLSSGGGGGGGSSDFSTATLTFINNSDVGTLALPFLLTVEDDQIPVGSNVYESGDYTIILYKGVCGITVINSYDYSVSGDAIDYGDTNIDAKGDCTITIS